MNEKKNSSENIADEEYVLFDSALKLIQAVSEDGGKGVISVLDQIQQAEPSVKFVSLWAVNWRAKHIVIVERTSEPYRPLYDGSAASLVECCCSFSESHVSFIVDKLKKISKTDDVNAPFASSISKFPREDNFHPNDLVSELKIDDFLVIPIWTSAHEKHPSHMLLVYLNDDSGYYLDFPADILGSTTTELIEGCISSLVEQRRSRRRAELAEKLLDADIESFSDLGSDFFTDMTENLIACRGCFIIRGSASSNSEPIVHSTKPVECWFNKNGNNKRVLNWLINSKENYGFISNKSLNFMLNSMNRPRDAIYSRITGSATGDEYSFIVCYNRRKDNRSKVGAAKNNHTAYKKFPSYFHNQDLEHLKLISHHIRGSIVSKYSEERRSAMIKMAAHELLAPVTDIRNLAQGIEKGRGAHGPGIANERILEASQLALTLTHANIVAFADDDYSGFESGFTNDVEDTFQRWKRMLMGACREHRFTNDNISFDIPKEVRYFRINQGVLATFFFNLVGNSIKYTQRGEESWCNIRYVNVLSSESPTLRQYPRRPRQIGDGVVFSVADNGPGFNSEEEKLALLPYQQFRRGNVVQGQGLGLHLVDRVASRLSGKVWIDKNYVDGELVDAGSRVCVWIPRRATS